MINLGNTHGDVAFMWVEDASFFNVEPDPRFITFKVMIASMGEDTFPEERQPAELEFLNEERHAQYFNPGFIVSIMAARSSDGIPKIYTIKNLDELYVVD